jgi:S-adenosylmethionine decarboxylase
MRDLAPDIVRQRLLIEGLFQGSVDEAKINAYFEAITQTLGLRMYGAPTIYSPAGLGRTENQGFDAFVPLVDSGISLYVWSDAKLVSVLIYSCKKFDVEKAAEVTRAFFDLKAIETQGI